MVKNKTQIKMPQKSTIKTVPFFNRSFDKKRLKLLFSWYYANKGEIAAFSLVENLQKLGFTYAMKAGISLGVDDLKVPPNKSESIREAIDSLNTTKASVQSGNVTALEEFQQFVDTWHRTSENLKTSVVVNFTKNFKSIKNFSTKKDQKPGSKSRPLDPKVIKIPLLLQSSKRIYKPEIKCFSYNSPPVLPCLQSTAQQSKGSQEVPIYQKTQQIVSTKPLAWSRWRQTRHQGGPLLSKSKELLPPVGAFGATSFLLACSAWFACGACEAQHAQHSTALSFLATHDQEGSPKSPLKSKVYHLAINKKTVSKKSQSKKWSQPVPFLENSNMVSVLRSYGNTLNPVYMMAFSGARGNLSQVRQLVGMRGLMADPQGQLVEFPIQSNFREGLTVTEYMISCYGARKGIVDTALRTAAAGYLTRRLVDVSHHQVVRFVTCGTKDGILLSLQTRDKKQENSEKNLPSAWKVPIKSSTNIAFDTVKGLKNQKFANNVKVRSWSNKPQPYSSLNPRDLSLKGHQSLAPKALVSDHNHQERVLSRQNLVAVKKTKPLTFCIGRVLARDIPGIAFRNQEVDISLGSSNALREIYETIGISVRSPLTCKAETGVCQLCYGWSVSANRLVGLGEAVGIIAAQSIGEPGTQLTMRTFHTGGVFSGDIMEECRAKHEGVIYFHGVYLGLMVRTAGGAVAFCMKTSGVLTIHGLDKVATYTFLPNTLLFVRQGERVFTDTLLAQIPNLPEIEEASGESTKTIVSSFSGEVRQTNIINRELENIRILSGQKDGPLYLPNQTNELSVLSRKSEPYSARQTKDLSGACCAVHAQQSKQVLRKQGTKKEHTKSTSHGQLSWSFSPLVGVSPAVHAKHSTHGLGPSACGACEAQHAQHDHSDHQATTFDVKEHSKPKALDLAAFCLLTKHLRSTTAQPPRQNPLALIPTGSQGLNQRSQPGQSSKGTNWAEQARSQVKKSQVLSQTNARPKNLAKKVSGSHRFGSSRQHFLYNKIAGDFFNTNQVAGAEASRMSFYDANKANVLVELRCTQYYRNQNEQFSQVGFSTVNNTVAQVQFPKATILSPTCGPIFQNSSLLLIVEDIPKIKNSKKNKLKYSPLSNNFSDITTRTTTGGYDVFYSSAFDKKGAEKNKNAFLFYPIKKQVQQLSDKDKKTVPCLLAVQSLHSTAKARPCSARSRQSPLIESQLGDFSTKKSHHKPYQDQTSFTRAPRAWSYRAKGFEFAEHTSALFNDFHYSYKSALVNYNQILSLNVSTGLFCFILNQRSKTNALTFDNLVKKKINFFDVQMYKGLNTLLDFLKLLHMQNYAFWFWKLSVVLFVQSNKRNFKLSVRPCLSHKATDFSGPSGYACAAQHSDKAPKEPSACCAWEAQHSQAKKHSKSLLLEKKVDGISLQMPKPQSHTFSKKLIILKNLYWHFHSDFGGSVELDSLPERLAGTKPMSHDACSSEAQQVGMLAQHSTWGGALQGTSNNNTKKHSDTDELKRNPTLWDQEGSCYTEQAESKSLFGKRKILVEPIEKSTGLGPSSACCAKQAQGLKNYLIDFSNNLRQLKKRQRLQLKTNINSKIPEFSTLTGLMCSRFGNQKFVKTSSCATFSQDLSSTSLIQLHQNKAFSNFSDSTFYKSGEIFPIQGSNDLRDFYKSYLESKTQTLDLSPSSNSLGTNKTLSHNSRGLAQHYAEDFSQSPQLVGANYPINLLDCAEQSYSEVKSNPIRSTNNRLILTHIDRISFKIRGSIGLNGPKGPNKNYPVGFRNSTPFAKQANTQFSLYGPQIGSFINIGDEVIKSFGSPEPGQIIEKSRACPNGSLHLTLRRTQNILYSNLHSRPAKVSRDVRNGNWLSKGTPLVTLPYLTNVTGDIVAGIPKIEQLFEARGEALYETIDKIWFFYKTKIVPLAKAVRECLKEIGLLIVSAIQKVYSSQGVHIADKHLEVIVRQMTRRAIIVNPGDTSFLPDEFIDLQIIERVNWSTYGENASYRPCLIGITKASLTSNSFLSSASFQQTARVLERETFLEKTDRLLGLKERVMMGAIIYAGTGDLNTNVRLPREQKAGKSLGRQSFKGIGFFSRRKIQLT